MSDSHLDREAILAAIRQNARAARHALGLTQEQTAERTGICCEYYARVERGHALPGTFTLVCIAQALAVPLDWLIGRVPPTPPTASTPSIATQ